MTQAASLDFLRARAIRLAHRLSPRAGPLTTVRARMRDGMMTGLSADLDGRGFSVGTADENDVILLDEQAQNAHLQVTSRRSAIGALVHLTSEQPGVSSGGVAIDANGIWERLPCRVDINGLGLDLDRADRANRVAATGMLYLGIFAVAAIALALFPAGTATHDLATVTEEREPIVRTAGSDELSSMLQTAGLGTYLNVESPAGGTLRVSGRIPKAQMETWRDVRIGWESREDTPPLVSRVSEMTGLQSLPPIAAVQLGASPYILLSNGNNITTGDVLTDGWSVKEIRPTSFLLTRNGEDIDIAF